MEFLTTIIPPLSSASLSQPSAESPRAGTAKQGPLSVPAPGQGWHCHTLHMTFYIRATLIPASLAAALQGTGALCGLGIKYSELCAWKMLPWGEGTGVGGHRRVRIRAGGTSVPCASSGELLALRWGHLSWIVLV